MNSIKDLKYLAAYINPFLAILGLLLGSYFTFLNVLFVFLLTPLLDLFSANSKANLSEVEAQQKSHQTIFDWLLYFNLPILIAVITLFIYTLESRELTMFELIGNCLSVGIVIGTCGINVGHELGHRKSKFENLLAQVLLIPAFYMHFFIEHNRGHHKNVATPSDPASAIKGDSLYKFWFTSTFGAYLSSWKIEKKRLIKKNKEFFSASNYMIWYSLIQSTYVILLFTFFDLKTAICIIISGVIGILLLETINYIEHYGLQRKKLENNRYERVMPMHSWNANFYFGRIVLYELTRHSDHHYLASKKYQLLNHHDNSPQLPYGYPLMMLLALFPFAWFAVIDKRIPKEVTP